MSDAKLHRATLSKSYIRGASLKIDSDQKFQRIKIFLQGLEIFDVDHI
jgi:hypothetical protein